jgi:hypothetical protein
VKVADVQHANRFRARRQNANYFCLTNGVKVTLDSDAPDGGKQAKDHES